MRLPLALFLGAFTVGSLTSSAVAEDALRVEAAAFFHVVHPGGFGEVACAIFNQTESPLRVFLEGHLQYEGAGRERLLGPTILEVPPGVAFEILPLFFVPEDAEAGPAEFTCRAHVAGPIARDERHVHEPPGRRDEARATFTVVE